MLYSYYNAQRGSLDTYTTDNDNTQLQLGGVNGALPLIMTADVKRTLDIIGPWLHPDTLHPFLLVGPQGCGKRYCATNSSKVFR